MKPEETKTETVAKILAAVYWRGRMEAGPNDPVFEDRRLGEYVVLANAERDADLWKAAADFVLSL